MESHKLSLEKSREFLFGGNSTFTIVSVSTGKRLTFKVKKHKVKDIFFVSYLYGENNDGDFKFIGTIFGANNPYKASNKGDRDANSQINKSFSWVYNTLITNNESKFSQFEFWHEGKCGKCGRKLTVPSSIESGFGPFCEKNR